MQRIKRWAHVKLSDTCIVTASQQRDLLHAGLCLTRQKVPSRIETLFDSVTKLFHLLLNISAARLEHRIKGSFFTSCVDRISRSIDQLNTQPDCPPLLSVCGSRRLCRQCVSYPLLCFKPRLKSHFPSREDKY